MKPYCIAIHGGAGDLPFWGMTPEREAHFREGLRIALMAGYQVLKNDGTALDAVERALVELENNPLFNAGAGSAINEEKRVEMDASIMCGKTYRAGAVSCVSGVKNPIVLARHVMYSSGHLHLAGEGAEKFAREMGLEFFPTEHFITEERMDWWKHEKNKPVREFDRDSGTAGAVALDVNGDLAAATSTGGLMMKRKGRVGDSSAIGAGTYADNHTCAVSCSGTGENIIRAVAAHEICCLLKYEKMSLSDACEKTMQQKLTPFGGQAGLVALDSKGSIKFVFNTPRMYRASITTSGEPQILLYKET